MKKLLAAGLLIFSTSAALAASHTVNMKSISFDPKKLTIKVGDTVEWKNLSYTPHSATSDDSTAKDSSFDTGLIEPKKTTKKVTFSKPGTFMYHCSIHGRAMTATVEVQP